MPYSALNLRKRAISLDGTSGFAGSSSNAGSFAVALGAISGADMTKLDSESPSSDTDTGLSFGGGTNFWNIWLFFPEMIDITAILLRWGAAVAIQSTSFQTSADTTNGKDGTWLTPTVTGTPVIGTTATDWWRANAPATLSGSGIFAIKALRIATGINGSAAIRGFHVFGTKSTAQTPDDIIFLGTDGVNEQTIDIDIGDIQAASAVRDTPIFVKNVSPSKTANNIVLDFQLSNTGDFTVSIDGGASFASTKTITSLAPGAIQPIIVRFTPPAASAANYTARASDLRAVVSSWS